MNAEREKVDVLAVMDKAFSVVRDTLEPPTDAQMEAARNAVAELIEADHEYEAARSDWDNATGGDPEALSDESWKRISERYERALMRRIHAIERIGSKP